MIYKHDTDNIKCTLYHKHVHRIVYTLFLINEVVSVKNMFEKRFGGIIDIRLTQIQSI